MILLIATLPLPLAAGPTPMPKVDDWLQFVIFAVIVLGSIISGLVNAARKKSAQGNQRRETLRRHIAEADRETLDGDESPFPQSDFQRPVARPMPPITPSVSQSRPAAQPVLPARPAAAQSAAELVKMLRERIETAAREQQEARRPAKMTIQVRREVVRDVGRPAPPRQVPPAPPRQRQTVSRKSQRPPSPARARPLAESSPGDSSLPEVADLAGSDEITNRERAWDADVDRRIGSVGVHIRPSSSDAVAAISGLSLDRSSLRRAIIMNELLGPPLALRDPLGSDDKWSVE